MHADGRSVKARPPILPRESEMERESHRDREYTPPLWL
jgi:hypothetical protein